MLIKAFAIFGQRHPLATTDKQLRGEPLFQLFNRFGQRRLRNRQRPAGAANTSFARDLNEGANVVKFNLK